MEIGKKNGMLFMNLGPGNPGIPLTHWDRDTFIFPLGLESFIGTSGISFIMGSDGKATGAILECLNSGGQGAFQRKPVREAIP